MSDFLKGALIMVIICVAFYFLFPVKQELFTSFSDDYKNKLSEEGKNFIKKTKMSEIEAEAKGLPIMKEQGPGGKMEENPLLLNNFEESLMRPDLQYSAKISQSDKDQWRITPESKGWLKVEADAVPNIYKDVERTLPY